MTGQVRLCRVTDEILALAEHVAAVDDPAAGATVSFAGVVRDHDAGRTVSGLEYQEHPTAAAVVAAVATEIAGRAGVLGVAVSHRTGHLRIGEIALAAAVSAAHRREAFAACMDLVDEVKRRLPVWKRQEFADGSDEWVGSA